MKKIIAFIFFSVLFNFFQVGLYSQPLSYKENIIRFRTQHWQGLIKDPRTTLKAGDSIYLDYYPIRESNKVFCKVTLLENELPFDMPTYSGQVKEFRKYALLEFKWKNKPTKLIVYQNSAQIASPIYRDYLFIPFKDGTSGRSTYAGGRYIDIKKGQIQNGALLLDLNQVYNPWCAYSDGYNCPIPPQENHLPEKIKSGEKLFKKRH